VRRTDREEADQVGGESLPFVRELVDEQPVAWPGDREVEREQRDRDGEHGVAEYLKPGPVHVRSARAMLKATATPVAWNQFATGTDDDGSDRPLS
jgi:hypothetical protein